VLVSTHYMDEAERCHAIAYLAYGKLMTQGTVDDVIARSGLVTYEVGGPDLGRIATGLHGKPGVEMVAAFGTSLHVSGTDAHALAQVLDEALRPWTGEPGLRVEQTEPTLEDVFIHLMNRSTDNFA
jgi:ABC-type multidrug transport system, ATPase component